MKQILKSKNNLKKEEKKRWSNTRMKVEYPISIKRLIDRIQRLLVIHISMGYPCEESHQNEIPHGLKSSENSVKILINP